MPNLKTLALTIAFAVAGVVVVWYTLPLVIPFIIAIFLSLLMEPIVKMLEKKKYISRKLAVVITMGLLLAFIGIIIALMVVRLAPELNKLSNSLIIYEEFFESVMKDLVKQSELFYGSLSPGAANQIEETIGNFTDSVYKVIDVIVKSLLSVVASIPGIILFTIIIFLGTFFISRDRELLRTSWLKWVPNPFGEQSIRVIREVLKAFWGYIRAQILLVTLTTTQVIIGLYLLGIEYAFSIGLLVGFFDLIPVLGPAAIFVPWIIWLFMFGSSVLAIKLLILYALVFVVRALLEAKVVASNVGLHPLTALVSMYVGLQLIGVLGLIIGPIFMVTLQAVLRTTKEYFDTKEEQ